MNLEEGLKKGLQIYAEGCLSSQYNMNMKDYTYELDFERNWVEFRMPHEPHNSRWLWSSFYSDINEIKDFLNSYVKDNFGDFVKEAFLEAKNEKLYGADIYGKIQAEIIRAEKSAIVYDIEKLKIKYPDIAGNILKANETGKMEVVFNDKELEIIKAEFDKTVAEYKRTDMLKNKADKIKKELEYVNNPNRYIDICNPYRDKTLAYPLIEYLNIMASQAGFDNYEDMLNEGFSVDYSGEYLKE